MAGRIEQALEGEIVDRQHRGGPRLAGELEVGRSEARLPVVAVDQIGPPVGEPAKADVGGDAASSP